jgi:WhiB family redox-sensing transcriptional regulator
MGSGGLVSFMEWKKDGLCKVINGDWMEVPVVSVKQQREAKAKEIAICLACPVQVECLEHALEFNEPMGVWGGTVPKERRAMRRQRVTS